MTSLKEDVPNQTWRKGCFGVTSRLTVLAKLSITTIRFDKDYLLKEAEAYRTLCSVSHYLWIVPIVDINSFQCKSYVFDPLWGMNRRSACDSIISTQQKRM